MLSAFLDWMREQGARFDRVTVVDEPPAPRGIFSTEAITRSSVVSHGNVVMTVPHHLIISMERARASSIGRAIEASGVELRNTQSILAAFLLQEMHDPASFWRPYLAVLPTSFPSLPQFFADDELRELRGSRIVDLIEARRQSLEGEYALLREQVSAFAAFSEAEFIWARCVVTSRVFGLALDEGETECLVPLADMLNHGRPRRTAWSYDKSARNFQVSAIALVPAHTAMNDSYGEKCNSRFLLNYGFVLDDNDANECAVRLRLPRGAGFRTVQLSRRDEGASLDPRLRSLYDDGERAMAALLVACDEALSRFDTTLAQDEALLARDDLGANLRNCIVLRRGEKQVLHHYRNLALARR